MTSWAYGHHSGSALSLFWLLRSFWWAARHGQLLPWLSLLAVSFALTRYGLRWWRSLRRKRRGNAVYRARGSSKARL